MLFFFSSRRRHTRFDCDWSSDVCSSDLGYLVDDPEGFQTELHSDVRTLEDNLDLWLISGSEQFADDPEVREALLKLAKHPDTRRCLALVGAILETPELVDRLLEVVG